MRGAALERCMGGGGGDATRLAAQAADRTIAIAVELETALHGFAAALESDIMSLAGCWGGMLITRYNFLSQVRGTRRRFRIQAAQVLPSLVGMLSGEDRKPERLEERLTRVIDVGDPLLIGLVCLRFNPG